MVGIVVVCHSRSLARAAVEMTGRLLPGPLPRIELAAGLDEHTLGTDAVQVKEAIERADGADGVLVLLDLGSALLSAELALDLLDDAVRSRVVLSPAPLVEGLLAAAAAAAGGNPLAEVAREASAGLAGKQAHLATAAPTGAPSTGDGTSGTSPGERGSFVVGNPQGLHARPAARLVAAVRGLDATVQLTNLTTGTGPVAASSLSRVATLGALPGHRVEVAATGPQAREALDQILALAGRRFDEVQTSAPVPGAEPHGPIAAAPGIAIGPARQARRNQSDAETEPAGRADDPVRSWHRLDAAISAVRRELAATRARVSAETDASHAAIFDMHLLLLDDAELLNAAQAHIGAGMGPARAWRDAYTDVEQRFVHLTDPYQQARAADVRAVGEQVLHQLLGTSSPELSGEGILVADELTPAEVADLDRRLVHGIVLAQGSPTSHAAILARTRGIPMLVAAGPEVLAIAEGTPLIVDADDAHLLVSPPEQTRAHYARRLAERRETELVAQRAAAGPAITRDGMQVPVLANVASVEDARAAAEAHADGVGLVRTEFLFASRQEPPSVAEQVAVYRAILDAFGGRRVVFRTLDAGADKPLPFLPSEPEANPFLGVRGIRLSLRRPEILRQQLEAICEAAGDAPVGVMFPMVTIIEELLAALSILSGACRSRRPADLQVGIMVEVPAVALKAAEFAPHVDFFSVGTNDLTQYALAVERGNPALTTLFNPLDPGVLRLVEELCRQSGDVHVSVCGEIAADPDATATLLALGVQSLSVSAPAVATIKQAVRRVTVR